MLPTTIRLSALALASNLALGCTQVSAGSDIAKSHHTAADEVNWVQTPFGPMASPVSGDFSKGEHITFIRFEAGMSTPLHTHSHDYVGVVLSGVTRHYTPGRPETEKALPAGSHWFIPGNLPHVSECLPGAECVMVLYQSDNMDFHPVQ